MCDGGGSHTNTFAALHAVIGYQYGGSGTNFLRPDLRRRMAAGMGSGYNLGETGGYENVTLTIAQMPSHSHSFALGDGTGPGAYIYLSWNANFWGNKDSSRAGGNQSHSNMPPYIVLNSIIFAGK